ncbi:SDR family NAD(P)-dependent oxidoreductase [Lysobacter sp. A286]
MGCVIVTGAAGGIGQALVRAFTDAGRLVIATDIVPQVAGLVCGHYIACDLARTVTDPGYAAQTFAGIRAVLDSRPLEVLVNNAAVQVLGPLESLDLDTWRHTLDVNLLAPFLWAQAFLPELEAERGCVLNISSIHAHLTKPGFVAYATSKAALSGMTRAMAVELGGRVRVNAIEPAAIATRMLREGFVDNLEGLAQLESCHPAGRIGTPDEVATLAVMIANRALGFMHGACVRLDGGIGSVLHDP